METFAAPSTRPLAFIAALFGRRPAAPESPSAPDLAPRDAQARRDFIQDVLTRSPNAFSGEVDVQNMMFLYPGRF
jgi:hypothetical protein